MRMQKRKISLQPLKRHRPLSLNRRRHPRLRRRANLLRLHLHRHRQRNQNRQCRKLPPNLRLALSKPAASGNILLHRGGYPGGQRVRKSAIRCDHRHQHDRRQFQLLPGTADSVVWLAENGGQAALTAAVKGNVDATFACLAAMDGAERSARMRDSTAPSATTRHRTIHRGGAVRINQLNTRPEDRQRELPVFAF